MDEAHVPTSWLGGVDADVYSQRRDPLGTLWRRIVNKYLCMLYCMLYLVSIYTGTLCPQNVHLFIF